MSPAGEIPALLGGCPVRPTGPPPWPPEDPEILEALAAAYRSGSWGRYHGTEVERLEQLVRDYHHAEHALTCGSGTFAVELALRALKVGPGDEVILAAYDYPGNFLSVHAVGAVPVLVDLDPANWNLAPENLAAAISPATKAILVSHLHGGLVPMADVRAFADQLGLAIAEDAAQVPGATVHGRKAGMWGDVGTWSFGGSKLLTAGRGGAMFTPRADVHQRARTWLQRGNVVCPLSELQAAVLIPQLAKLDERNRRRACQVELLVEQLAGIPGLRPFVNRDGDTRSAYYKVGFQFDEEAFGLSRTRFVEALRAEGVAFDEGFHALHIGRSPRRFRAAGDLIQAGRAHGVTLVLHHPVLLGSDVDIADVARAVRKVWEHRVALR